MAIDSFIETRGRGVGRDIENSSTLPQLDFFSEVDSHREHSQDLVKVDMSPSLLGSINSSSLDAAENLMDAKSPGKPQTDESTILLDFVNKKFKNLKTFLGDETGKTLL